MNNFSGGGRGGLQHEGNSYPLVKLNMMELHMTPCTLLSISV